MAVHLDVLKAADEFESLLGRLHPRNLPEFFEVVSERIAGERNKFSVDGTCKAMAAQASAQPEMEGNNSDVMLRSIATELRAHPLLPPDAVARTEKVLHPTHGEFACLDPETVVSVDKFLYEDDDAIDEMCDEGMLSRNYCLDCNSHRTAPLNFVSHSASLLQLKYIFHKALPDLSGKTVVDVGSRLGTVLYGAYFCSGAARIVGIEMNPELCAIQKDIVKKFGLNDRIQIIHADVCTQASVLQQADVVVLHNVFEFFAPRQMQISIWKFLRKTLSKKDCYLVTVPSLEHSLEVLKLPLNLASWVKPICLDHLTMWIKEDELREEAQLITLYQIV